jgi:hypothetical protein
VLVLAVPEDLDKLLEDGGLAAIAALGELGRVVVVAIDWAPNTVGHREQVKWSTWYLRSRAVM